MAVVPMVITGQDGGIDLQFYTAAASHNYSFEMFRCILNPLLLQAEQKVTLHGSTGSGKTWVASNVA